MIEKFKVRLNWRWDCEPKITRVECERETDKCVWIKGRRNLKESEYATYFDTFDLAKRALVVRQTQILGSNEHKLTKSEEVLIAIKELKDQTNR